MLSLRQADVSYGRVQALYGVSVDVVPGEMRVLLGANGAGKTTALRALSGLVAAPVVLDDEPITDFAAAGVAHIPEGRGTFGRLTVAQNLLMGLYPRRRERRNRRAEVRRMLDLFPELGGRLWQKAGTLSGGEQQMLAVARALISRPRYLLVDEPSHGLAPRIVAGLFEMLDGLRHDGMGILVVEQYVSVALKGASMAYVLERGRVTFAGPADSLDAAQLEKAYLG